MGTHGHLSPFDAVMAMIADATPRLRCEAATREQWQTWRIAFEAALRANLGKTPQPVPLNAEVTERVDCGDHWRERVLFDTTAWDTVPAYVLVPKDLAPGERRPGVLAAHGHGPGKSDLVGSDPAREERVLANNDDYARQFVRRGYVVVAPDWRGFGERQSPAQWVRSGRDRCNVNYMAYGYFGYHLLTLQIWDGMRTLDYLASRPEVIPDRIGCVGLSFGGTMTTYLAALDSRVRVACISGYISTVAGDAMTLRGNGNFCGAQYSPGLLDIGDIPDVACLIAPRPLLVEMGAGDTCFVIEDAQAAYSRVERLYRAIGAGDKIAADVFDGGHRFSGAMAFDWFARWL
jgi:dienelactone hydrolase